MNMLLNLHLLGAATTGITILLAIYSLIKNNNTYITLLIKILGGLSIFEVTTGAGLSILGNGTIQTFCTQIGIYLTIIIATQIALVSKSNAPQNTNTIALPHLINSAVIIATIFILV